MTRVLSGIQPTGDMHLGNYLGAVRNWVEDQHAHDALFCVVDLHALTTPQDPATLRAKTLETATLLLAAGLDPAICTLFVQSHVPEHTELTWLVQCTTSVGELQRMTQFKEKAARLGGDLVSAGLLTYPTLMAADILVYDADRVPVGDDQRQHLELTRDVAMRFNNRYGPTFVVPEAAIPTAGARVMDLQEPTSKMSKSIDSPQGSVRVLDPPDVVARKFRRAVTDGDGEVRFDVAAKPGVSNLLSILAAATGRSAEAVAADYSQYGPLKQDAADAVVAVLEPLQERYAELRSDPTGTAKLLAAGAEKARELAGATVARAKAAVGLLAPFGA